MDNDESLMRRYRTRGDEQALETIVMHHQPWVNQVCLRICRDRMLADDATQAVFILLARKAQTWSESIRLTGWLQRTATHFAWRAQRSERRRKHHEKAAATVQVRDCMHPDGNASGNSDPEALQQEAGIRRALDQAIARLSAHQQQIVVRCYLRGQSQVEIAAALGCSPDAVRKRLADGIERLRSILKRRGVQFTIPLLITIASPGYAACPASRGVEYIRVIGEGLDGPSRAAALAKTFAASDKGLAIAGLGLKTWAWAAFLCIGVAAGVLVFWTRSQTPGSLVGTTSPAAMAQDSFGNLAPGAISGERHFAFTISRFARCPRSIRLEAIVHDPVALKTWRLPFKLDITAPAYLPRTLGIWTAMDGQIPPDVSPVLQPGTVIVPPLPDGTYRFPWLNGAATWIVRFAESPADGG